MALAIKNLPANAGDTGTIPGLERSPGGGHGNPVLHSCLGNTMDRRAWWAIVHGITKRQTHLSNWKHILLSVLMKLGVMFSQSSNPLVFSLIPSTCKEMSNLPLTQPHASLLSPSQLHWDPVLWQTCWPSWWASKYVYLAEVCWLYGLPCVRGYTDTLVFLLPFYSFNKHMLTAFSNPNTISVAETKQNQIHFFWEFTFSLGVILKINNENTENLRW